MTKSETLALMEHAAREAGVSLLQDFANRDALVIEAKKPSDFVSQADRKSEQIIVNILRTARPDWGILGEEGSDISAGESGYRWIIDPLDGTTNFLHGLPNWCVTIALEKEGEIIAAMTFDVIRDELFFAEKGQGAFLNHKKITVFAGSELDRGIVGMDTGWFDDIDYLANTWRQGYDHAASIITLGAAALTLAYMAAGRFAVCHVVGVQPWDVAAGILLIREAGGVVTDLSLAPAQPDKGETVAGNPGLHDKYTTLIGLK